MKNILLLAVLLFPASALASTAPLLGVFTTDNVPPLTLGYTDQFGNFTAGGLLGAITFSGGTTTFASSVVVSGGVDPHNTVFSTVITGNPLMLMTVQDIPVASVNATGGYAFVAGATGRKIYPGALTVMVSGTAASATALKIVCTSGTLLASIPIANLVNNVPVTVLSSTSASPAGQAFARGCAAGDSVLASNVGSSMTTTTDVFVNMPYTTQ